MPHNPNYRPKTPPFPWKAEGNRIKDANGKTICVFFDVPDPSWMARYLAEVINENQTEIFPS
jgi:hypothetical protein